MLRRVLRDLWDTRAATRPEHPDPGLRTRRWTFPPGRVWDEACGLADGGLPGWTLVEADREAGVIRAEARTRVFGFVDDIRIRVRAEGGRTRVDVTSESRVGVTDLGKNPRRVRRFLRELESASR